SATIAMEIWKNRRARASAFRRTGIAGSLGDERTMNVDAGRAIAIFILIQFIVYIIIIMINQPRRHRFSGPGQNPQCADRADVSAGRKRTDDAPLSRLATAPRAGDEGADPSEADAAASGPQRKGQHELGAGIPALDPQLAVQLLCKRSDQPHAEAA